LIPKQFRIHLVLIIAAVFMIIYPILNEKPDAEKAEKATAVAMEFLDLIDAEKYAESWQMAAGMMKEKVTEKDWIEKLTKARGFSGALVERSMKSTSYSLTVPDGPDGEYILLTFNSSYQRVEKAIELVNVMVEDGHWKVVAYIANTDN